MTSAFSTAERDRRWSAVRRSAAAAGLDCVLVPPCVDGENLCLSLEQSRGTRSDCRYLTMLDDIAVVLPTDGRPPIVLGAAGDRNDWVTEVRPASTDPLGSRGPPIADALVDLGMERARIGVSGLRRGRYTHARADDGVVCHGAFAEIVRRLPRAAFEDATDVVGRARFVKSDEEIEALRQGAAIAEEAIATMVETVRPGLDETELYARVMGRLLELGSDYYDLALVTGLLGARPTRITSPRPSRRFQPMELVDNEVDAVWGGLIAQEKQPILLGAMPVGWERLVDLQGELFELGLELLRPGALLGEVMDTVRRFGDRHGVSSDVLLHGRGYGNDGPLLTPIDRGEHLRDVRLERGNAFVWKPTVASADGRSRFSWGGDVPATTARSRCFAGAMGW